jgi:hypothetical protein
MVAGAHGIVAVLLRVFDGIIFFIIEGIVTLLFIAGGVTMAVMIRGGKCNDFVFTAYNKIINCGGSIEIIDGNRWWYGLCTLENYYGDVAPPGWTERASKVLQQRCEEATADYGLMFVVVLLSVAAIGLGYYWRRSVGK